jgi:hypothetical protein
MDYLYTTLAQERTEKMRQQADLDRLARQARQAAAPRPAVTISVPAPRDLRTAPRWRLGAALSDWCRRVSSALATR